MAAKQELLQLLKRCGATQERGKRNLKWFIPGGAMLVTPKADSKNETNREWNNCLARLRLMMQGHSAKPATVNPRRTKKHKTAAPFRPFAIPPLGDVEAPPTLQEQLAKQFGVAYDDRRASLRDRYSRRIHEHPEPTVPTPPEPVGEPTPQVQQCRRTDRPRQRKLRPIPASVRTFTREEIEIANRIKAEKGDAAMRQYLNSLTEERREAERLKRESDCPNQIIQTRSYMPSNINVELKRLDAAIAKAEKRIEDERNVVEEKRKEMASAESRIKSCTEFIETAKMYRGNLAEHPEVVDFLSILPTAPVVPIQTGKHQPTGDEIRRRNIRLAEIFDNASKPMRQVDVLREMNREFPNITPGAMYQLLVRLVKQGDLQTTTADDSRSILYQKKTESSEHYPVTELQEAAGA